MAHFRSLASAMFLMSTLITLASCTSNQQQSQPDNRASDESAIRAIDADWVKAAAAKDPIRFVVQSGDAVQNGAIALWLTPHGFVKGVAANMATATAIAVSRNAAGSPPGICVNV